VSTRTAGISGHVTVPTFRALTPSASNGATLNMPRKKAPSGQLKQQILTGFLIPNSSKTSSPRKRTTKTKSGAARLASRAPLQLSEPSDQGGSDSDVDAIHFEPRKVTVISDDDIQPSSPVRKRKTAAEVELHADHETSTFGDSDDSVDTNRKATSSTMIKRRVSRSPSTDSMEHSSPPKRRRLARGIRPSTPEEPNNLLDEVNEEGNYSIEACKVTTNPIRRYHPVSLS
jgi:hypothetical protein